MVPSTRVRHLSSRKVVVLVEDHAHVLRGHFPKTFAEIAEGLLEIGCRVEVLTSMGWALDNPDRRFGLHRYGPLASVLFRSSGYVGALTKRLDRHGRWGRRLGATTYRIGLSLRTLAAVVACRSLDRRFHLEPVGVVLNSKVGSVPVLERCARRYPWIVRKDVQSMPPSDGSPPRLHPRVALAITDPGWGPTWSGLPVVEIGHAVAPGLGLPLRQRLDRSDGDWRRPPITYPGYRSLEEMDDLFAAADLVVVSMGAGFPSDSAVVLDAVSHGTPVVVSAPSLPARWVEAFGAGELFDAGSAASLGAALDRIDLEACRRGALELREHRSAEAIAKRYLETLEAMN